MTKLALNKSSLSRKKRELAVYERFLPPLDLKRRQVLMERNRERLEVAAVGDELRGEVSSVGGELPMLSNRAIGLDRLVVVNAVHVDEQKIVGMTLPVLREVDFAVQEYGYFTKPHWVDRVVEALRRVAALHIREQIARERLRRLEAAAKKLTQRVNLFEKVLIPRTKAEIRRIEIFLSDSERTAVVRSKIAKHKHERAAR